jgi:hypothetical protein
VLRSDETLHDERVTGREMIMGNPDTESPDQKDSL